MRSACAATALVVALGSMSGCGVQDDRSGPRQSGRGVAAESCPILAEREQTTFRGYSVDDVLPRGGELTPAAALVDCLNDDKPAPSAHAFRIVGVDPQVAFLVSEYADVVFVSVPVDEAPILVRDALG